MRKIKTNLINALLRNGAMEFGLYRFELEELVDELKNSLAEDKDEIIFAITEHSDHVAMVLIEPSGMVYINESARERLKALWKKAYIPNIKKLMPYYLDELSHGRIPVQGVKTILTGQA